MTDLTPEVERDRLLIGRVGTCFGQELIDWMTLVFKPCMTLCFAFAFTKSHTQLGGNPAAQQHRPQRQGPRQTPTRDAGISLNDPLSPPRLTNGCETVDDLTHLMAAGPA